LTYLQVIFIYGHLVIYIPPNGLSCADVLLKTTALIHYVQCESKNHPCRPAVFWHFHKRFDNF